MTRSLSVAALVVIFMALVGPGSVQAQEVLGPPSPYDSTPLPTLESQTLDVLDLQLEQFESSGVNPLAVIESAGSLLNRNGDSSESGLSAGMSIMLLLTVISVAPSIMLMTTCFVRIIIVLTLLRQAIGTQQLPPPQVIVGIAMFMTMLVMAPTIDRIYAEAVVPYQNGEIRDHEQLWNNAKQPLRDFMFDQIEATGNWSSVYMMLNYRGIDTSDVASLTRSDVDMVTLVPSFMLSELKTAFLMGFRVYMPFLVIDMVIASLLISMSMMMLPPILISLPFKVLLFVMVDGWQLIVGSLMSSFVQDGLSPRLSEFSSAAGLVTETFSSVSGLFV